MNNEQKSKISTFSPLEYKNGQDRDVHRQYKWRFKRQTSFLNNIIYLFFSIIHFHPLLYNYIQSRRYRLYNNSCTTKLIGFSSIGNYYSFYCLRLGGCSASFLVGFFSFG